MTSPSPEQQPAEERDAEQRTGERPAEQAPERRSGEQPRERRPAERPAERSAARSSAERSSAVRQPAGQPSGAGQSAGPAYADRVYRSAGGIAGGAMMLLIILWLGGDALVRGTGRTPWLALAGMLFAVPLIAAYTVRPAVFANRDRLRVRNPLRTITLPWGVVTDVRARFSCEVFTESGKYQMWAVPVSLRQRKRADRRQGAPTRSDPFAAPGTETPRTPTPALADQAVADLRDLSERAESRPEAQGEPVVRWAYEVIAPALAGLVLLVVLLLTG
ncbi:PH domain-containing protein [Streptomyces sp. NPDC095613]|uniref:PH domain-containing protein n=1 Tax=Streptomyces sp. NPDC095613 TaxID=3155540 RepID=UPI0033287C33